VNGLAAAMPPYQTVAYMEWPLSNERVNTLHGMVVACGGWLDAVAWSM